MLMFNMAADHLLIFDDAAGRWGPMTDLRPVFEIRTGALTNRQRIQRSLGMVTQIGIVPAELCDWGDDPVEAPHDINTQPDDGNWLLVNGRWPGLVAADQIQQLPIGSSLVQPDGQIIALHLDHRRACRFLAGDLMTLPQDMAVEHFPETVLHERPWHVLDNLESNLRADLDAINLPECDVTRHGGVMFGDHKVYVGQNVTFQPQVVFNTQHGPIVIDRDAMIGAISVLEGPCYIGPASQVSCHTHIRPITVVGPVCKVAGEISHTVFQGYSNKGHHGYLGHSLVGQWVNLGAATNTSNLKNTYGQVHVQLSSNEPQEPTGRMYHGPLLGDFTRTAIGTRLLTGSCVGTGSMIARSSYAPKYIERLSFLTDTSCQPYDIDKFLATARTMMARRDRDLYPALETRLRELAQTPLAACAV